MDADLPFRVLPAMSKWDWSELPRLREGGQRMRTDVVFLCFVGHAYDFHPMVTFVPTIVQACASAA